MKNRSGSCMNNEYKANYLSESNNVASLCSIRKRNLNKLVAAHLNINSLRLKFDSFVQKITGNIDILMKSKIKLDNSFPEGQSLIEGYSKHNRMSWRRYSVTCKSRYSIKTFVHRVVINGRILCRDKPPEKRMVAMILLQPR